MHVFLEKFTLNIILEISSNFLEYLTVCHILKNDSQKI